ncbi:MAG: hypothetical protein JSV94_04780 [Methanobacteriota archaeon]|nr:MAG: hypothetical protein JSV94_04780 [Euryarchaeota archaeon]
MERKIIGIMLTLVVVAVVVIGVVMIAAVDIKKGGGFTGLFDQLENSDDATHEQLLEIPDDWEAGDIKTVSDTIVDMYSDRQSVEQTTVYVTTLYFVYLGDKWNNPDDGTNFYVPIADEDELRWKEIDHGLFSIQVSSATNLSAEYNIGDVIELETTITEVYDDEDSMSLAFGKWAVADTL